MARSWLLVPGTAPARFDSAQASRAAPTALAIEVAVDPARTPAARDDVVAWLTGGGEAWVRINDRSTDFWSGDVDALLGLPGLHGVMLAKTEAPEHVTETFDRLGGAAPVLAPVASALRIEESPAPANARGALRLAFGSGDSRRATGTRAAALAMAYPRSRLVVASRIGGRPGPIDGPTVGSSHPVLREQSGGAVALGLTGKLCLDVEQLPVINEVIRPTPSDAAWAQDFPAAFGGRGRVTREGRARPRLGRAQKIEKLASAFGVQPAS
ncbi:aldolase [Frigoribacterium sp. RIT-PI-h]|nr:aldolase [Frigoribacterium sp. RIT-PI-h]